MEQWQFLIQKQGDRSWHNLESPNLEISEGWYRVLARSHLRNTDVEIRIIHSSISEISPKRQIQRRSQRTNAEGLMAVIPFTHLQPGIWELQCSGDLISDLFGKSWQYGIYLQVFSEESPRVWGQSHTGENIASNLPQPPDAIADGNLKSAITPEPLSSSKSDQEPTDLPSETVTDGTDIEPPVSPVFLKGESAEQILQNLMDLALPISETLLEEGKVEDNVAIKPRTPLCLTLERETHVAHWGEIVVIHGRVDLQDQTNQESDTAPPEILYALELVIELRSPLSSEILTQVRQPLPNSSLPMVISSAIDIPIDCESKLILADINLYGALTEFGEVIILANQSFTITADVTELLAITAAAKFSEQNLLDHPIEPPTELETSISIDLRLFNLAKTTQINHSPFIQISRNKSLPPQLNPEELKAAGRRVSQLNKLADSRLPQLPKLPENQITVKVALTEGVATADVVTDQELVEKDKTRASINLAQLVIKNHRRRMLNSTFPYLKRLKVLPDNTPDAFSLPDDQDSPQIDTTVCEHENTFELVAGDAEFQDDSPDLELLELNAEANLCSSPLIRKWTQSQGFSLPESVISILDQQKLPDEQVPLSTQTVEISSSLDVEPQTDIGADQIPVLPDATLMAIAASAMEIQEMATFEQPEAISVLSPDSQLPPADYLWLTQEFVVEDIYTQPVGDVIDSYSSEQHSQPISDLSHTPLMQGVIVEPLPIPLLHVPDGELIGGTSVRVRVELPAISPQIVVKLWVEDCQTRWLLDGPHVLTDLLPNSLGSLFVITQLNIPYGCLEIRVEAIAFNQLTQQESHKVTVVRTVIPPDLPNLQLDQLLGI